MKEGNEFFILDENDSYYMQRRSANINIPNQKVGSIAANVNSNGYQLFDRWSPQFINIDIPYDVKLDTMEIYDLNIWDNDLHTSNLEITKNDSVIRNNSGQFTGFEQIDISELLTHGQNALTLIQNDLLGGQVLITFPLNSLTYNITGEVTLTDTNAFAADVEIILSGALNDTIHPDSSGFYYFTDLLVGNYTVTPFLTNFEFTPAYYDYSPLDSNKYNQDFLGNIIPTYNITGEVTLLDSNYSVTDVEMNLTGDFTNTINPDDTGYYHFSDLFEGDYTVTPAFTNFEFTPVSYSYSSLNTDTSKQNFIGSLVNSIQGKFIEKIRIYPNPAKNKLYIEFYDNTFEIEKLLLYNTLGELIYTKEGKGLKAQKLEIDLFGYKAGFYYLNIKTEDGVLRKKISVIK